MRNPQPLTTAAGAITRRQLLARCLGFVLSLGFVNAVFAGQGDLVLRLPAQTALKQRQFPLRTNEGLTNLMAAVEALIRLSETQRQERRKRSRQRRLGGSGAVADIGNSIVV